MPAFWHHAFDVARAADDADGDADVFVALNRFARGGGGPPVACGAAPRPGPPEAAAAAALADARGIPRVAMGFYGVPPGAASAAHAARALSLGYRHLDTAEMYGNAGDVGRAAAAVRGDVFLTSKLDMRDPRRSRRELLDRAAAQAAALGGAADLLLLHSPHAPTAGDRVAAWRALLAARDGGLAAFVGVSNFGIRHLEELEAAGLERPAVNQVELHPWLRRDGLAAWCASRNVTLAAYSPLGKARRLDGAAATRAAAAAGTSPAAAVLRWAVDRGHAVVVKAASPAHALGNLALGAGPLPPAAAAFLDAAPQAPPTGWDPTRLDGACELPPLPRWLWGSWRRAWMRGAAGRASTAPAAYVQTPLAFVDVRPAEGRGLAGVARVDDGGGVGDEGPVVVWHGAPGDYRDACLGADIIDGAGLDAGLVSVDAGASRPPAGAAPPGFAWDEVALGGDGEVYDPRDEVDEAPRVERWVLHDAPETFAAARRGAELLVVAGDAFGYADGDARVYRIGRVSAGWAVDFATDGSAGTRLALASLDGWEPLEPRDGDAAAAAAFRRFPADFPSAPRVSELGLGG